MRSDIFLADLIEGLAALGIRDPETAKEVLRMLSLDRLESGAAASLEGAWAPAAVTPRRADDPVVSDPVIPQTDPAPSLTAQRQARLRPVPRSTAVVRRPEWLLHVNSVARPAGPTVTTARVEPLFPRNQTRGLLTTALSTWNADGPLDVGRVVEMLARLEPIRRLPFEITATARRGVQVLIDTGLCMAPYRADTDHIVRKIESIVTSDQMQVYFFSGCPSRECALRGETTMKPWPSPPRGTPVFMITDLGIGTAPGSETRAGVEEWLDFAEQVRVTGSSLCALVPYGPRRWPRPLARAMRIIHWDRRTTAAIVRRGLSPVQRGRR
ncbi:MAG: hypothetical protein ABIS29_06980 [Vicinamibacterales bacterium]